uniref:ShKT domain-containing protein n=1 Tax=Panagrolaimus davidi TaxID=227884 RepID=A0A914QRD1_9BILA
MDIWAVVVYVRPCQDIYKSCERWLEEKRCEWAKPISPFFFDNCPLTCGKCTAGNKKLRLPLPPILEPLSWLIGKWRTRTSSSGSRFPLPLLNAYEETLSFSISEVPAFDRPPLNVRLIYYANCCYEASQYLSSRKKDDK